MAPIQGREAMRTQIAGRNDLAVLLLVPEKHDGLTQYRAAEQPLADLIGPPGHVPGIAQISHLALLKVYSDIVKTQGCAVLMHTLSNTRESSTDPIDHHFQRSFAAPLVWLGRNGISEVVSDNGGKLFVGRGRFTIDQFRHLGADRIVTGVGEDE